MANGIMVEAVDFRYILLDDYKKLGIQEEEVAVIFMIDHLSKQGNKLINADLLALKMNYKVAQIDQILAALVKKDFLTYEVHGKETVASLEPLKKKLYQQFQLDLAKDRQNLMSAERSEKVSRLYRYFEARLKRTLSPLENDQLAAWLDEAFTEEDIKGALEDVLSEGKRSFKSVDKKLRQFRKRDDIAKEGVTSVDEAWAKDIRETIEIAKARWVDDEEE